MTPPTETIAAIRTEIEGAKAQWPGWPTDPVHAAAIVAEEAGELVRAANGYTYGDDAEQGAANMRTEAVQAAAMAVRFAAHVAGTSTDDAIGAARAGGYRVCAEIGRRSDPVSAASEVFMAAASLCASADWYDHTGTNCGMCLDAHRVFGAACWFLAGMDGYVPQPSPGVTP